jgi:hypothetical protein
LLEDTVTGRQDIILLGGLVMQWAYFVLLTVRIGSN